MHGPAFTGDNQEALEALAADYDRRLESADGPRLTRSLDPSHSADDDESGRRSSRLRRSGVAGTGTNAVGGDGADPRGDEEEEATGQGDGDEHDERGGGAGGGDDDPGQGGETGRAPGWRR